MARVAKGFGVVVLGTVAALTVWHFFAGHLEIPTTLSVLPASNVDAGETIEAKPGRSLLAISTSDSGRAPPKSRTEEHPVDPYAAMSGPGDQIEVKPQEPEFAQRLAALAASETSASSLNGHALAEQPAQWCFLAGAWTGATYPTAWRLFWTTEEQAGEEYFLTSDSSVVWNGSRSVALRTSASGKNIAVAWQAVNATPYRGSRVELSAYIRKTPRAGRLFIGVHDAARPSRGYENEVWLTELLPLTWTSVAVALMEVPPWATVLYYGVETHNGGSLWLDDVRIAKEEPLPSTQPPSIKARATVRPRGVYIFVLTPPAFLSEPSNLDFEVTKQGAYGVKCGAPAA